MPAGWARGRADDAPDDIPAQQLGRGQPQPGCHLRDVVSAELEYQGGKLRRGDREVAVPSDPQVAWRGQREGSAGHAFADDHGGDRNLAGGHRDEQLRDRRPDAGRLIGRGGRRAGGVDQREDRQPETRGQPKQAGRGPEPGWSARHAGLRDIRDRGALMAAESAAHAGIHAPAAVTANLEPLPEVARQPSVRAGPAWVARAVDVGPGVRVGRPVAVVWPGWPQWQRRTAGTVAAGAW